ncbi:MULTISPECIES: hypothetical protein [unclassified Herbaspirillum]|uniref:hypothetical protein n=1 Tax=unclassified Herbaspirillum TaxID=2624150 RepID=UPI00114FC0A1|nr:MULTISPECIES: hypothetical protein [unclassified Herbaspirillum]MBB5391064.1 hypothetical protein [Herbaspirillum sp. SJZ102]
MSEKGRKKKYNNLTKTNLYLEQETLDIFKEAVRITNELRGDESMTLSIIIRNLLKQRAPILLQQLKDKKENLTSKSVEVAQVEAVVQSENNQSEWANFFGETK